MAYRVIFEPTAQRQMKRLDRLPIYRRLRQRILALADDPRPPGCRKLTGHPGWRIRVGDYRVVYEIDDVVRLVAIERVQHRDSVYDP